jgi:thiamine biosynthesis lipoprotein
MSLFLSGFWRRTLCLPFALGFLRGVAIPAAAEERFAFEKAEMGLPVRVTLYAPNEAAAIKAADAAFSRIEALNAIFTDYDSDSELSRLSESSGGGRVVAVSAELWHVLEYAQRLAQRSAGAFDITVGPVVNLWRTARRKKELPAPERLRDALARSGYEGMRLDRENRTVELTKPRMRLDAGGIAKGYAMEEALKVLRQAGYSRAMVSGGGDMALGDAPPGQTGWSVEIVALDSEGAPAPERLRLANRSVSTSGDLYQRLEIEGKRYSHIVDPRTGIGLTDHSQVTVIAERGMQADALSKVVAVLGAEAGFPVIEETPGVACRFVRAPGGVVEERRSLRWAQVAEATQEKGR